MRASARYRICDRTMTATHSARNKIAGCGTLLPTRSIRSSTPLGFFSVLTPGAGLVIDAYRHRWPLPADRTDPPPSDLNNGTAKNLSLLQRNACLFDLFQ